MIKITIIFFSFIAGLVTGVGALIAVAIKNPSDRLLSGSLGFASGIMIGISTLSLLPESLATGNLYISIGGFASGALFLGLIDMALPHVHKSETDCDMYMKMGYFVAFGIALHNLPEGIAIGASNEVSPTLGLFTAVSIGIHNVAEGLSVAMPLCRGQVKRLRIVFITALTGLATVIGTIIGILLMKVTPFFISYSLAFAAGAMIYIAIDELIPHSHGVHTNAANVGIVLGILAALLLQ